MTLKLPTNNQTIDQNGLTLVELLIAAAIGLITVYAAGDLLVNFLQSAERAESLERQRENWGRTGSFLEAEIALSERIYNLQDSPASLTIPTECKGSQKIATDSELRLGLDQSKLIPPIIYFVKESTTGWLPSYSLWRCGPSFDIYGRFTSEITTTQLLDGLAENAIGHGFNIDSLGSNGKRVSFDLTLSGRTLQKTYSQVDATLARIMPLFVRPSESTYCDGNTYVKIRGDATRQSHAIALGAIQEGDDILICGEGGGDIIAGSDEANDILEAGDLGVQDQSYGALIVGFSGNDYLIGTNAADVLSGGDDDDTLIGKDGNDKLLGGCGANEYLPGEGNNHVYGDGRNVTIPSEHNPTDDTPKDITTAFDPHGLPMNPDSCPASQEPYDVVYYTGDYDATDTTKSDYTLEGATEGGKCTSTECKVIKKNGTKNDSSDDTVDILYNIETLIFNNARIDLTQ